MTIDEITNFTSEVKDVIRDWFKNDGFKDRKLTDTPTDDLMVVNKKYVDDNTSTPEWTHQSTLGITGTTVQSFSNLPVHDFYKLRFSGFNGSIQGGNVPSLSMQIAGQTASTYGYIRGRANVVVDNGTSNGDFGLMAPQAAGDTFYGYNGEFTINGKAIGSNSVIGLWGSATGFNNSNDNILLRGEVSGVTAASVTTIKIIPNGTVGWDSGVVELWTKDLS